jgi:imidazole glycerol-phosphate synthase subunit HisF
MTVTRVIPCLDVRDGRVVKGVRFQGLRDAGDPATQAARYALEGADEVVLLDISATLEGRQAGLAAVEAVRTRLDIPLTVGGGIASVEDARRLLQHGADKVGVNSAAVRDPALLDALSGEFGRQCVVLAVDARRLEGTKNQWEVLTRSGSRAEPLDVLAWCAEGARRGTGEILLTSWDRDGTQQGYDLDLLRAVRDAVDVPVIASGGAASPEHMAAAAEAGADAVLAASIFHDRRWTIGAVKSRLKELGTEVRT